MLNIVPNFDCQSFDVDGQWLSNTYQDDYFYANIGNFWLEFTPIKSMCNKGGNGKGRLIYFYILNL